jgi:hypothetical protein
MGGIAGWSKMKMPVAVSKDAALPHSYNGQAMARSRDGCAPLYKNPSRQEDP